MDFEAWDQRVEMPRINTLTEIFQERGIGGIFALAEKGNSQRIIGKLLVSGILIDEQIEDLILQCISSAENDSSSRDGIVVEAFWTLDEGRRQAIYACLRGKVSEDKVLHFLLLSPYRASTWELVDQLSPEARNRYWAKVVPQCISNAPDENKESVQRLLEFKRPRAAFAAMRLEPEEIDQHLLVQILSDMAENSNDNVGEYQLCEYDVQRVFKHLNSTPDFTLEEKARLELIYIKFLVPLCRGDGQQQVPNLERYVEEYPEQFVQAVVWAYKRKDRGEDPAEFRVTNDRELFAELGHFLLKAIEFIPGQNEATKEQQREKLKVWVATVRSSCAELSRAEVADDCLGKLFSNAPLGDDGVWPNEVVRDVMEELKSEHISDGALTGLYNARGAYCRGEGGSQELELANKYRSWAEA